MGSVVKEAKDRAREKVGIVVVPGLVFCEV
jgi:hypothetical protein